MIYDISAFKCRRDRRAFCRQMSCHDVRTPFPSQWLQLRTTAAHSSSWHATLARFYRHPHSALARDARYLHNYYKKQNTRNLNYRKYDRAVRPIHGCPEKFRESWLRPRLLFQKFVMGFCSDRYQECAYKIWSSYSFTRSWDIEIIAIAVFGWGCESQSWGTGGRKGRGWYSSKKRWWVSIGHR